MVLRDHRVGGQKVFPGAAGLELALAGVSRGPGKLKCAASPSGVDATGSRRPKMVWH